MEGTDFARELVQHFGQDRFYHCYMRNGGNIVHAVQIHAALAPPEIQPWQFVEFFNSIGLRIDESLASKAIRHPEKTVEWEDMCRVAFGFCKFWKEFGRRTHELPDHIHIRMILGDKNEWTEKYAELLIENKNPDGE
jgi:hypothetical protein